MHTRTTGRPLCRLTATLAMLAASAWSHATDQAPPLDLPVTRGAEAAHQVEADQVRRDWRLDPAIFTDISPVNAPDIAIKLPEDQREDQ
jgi:hypothetical protein